MIERIYLSLSRCVFRMVDCDTTMFDKGGHLTCLPITLFGYTCDWDPEV